MKKLDKLMTAMKDGVDVIRTKMIEKRRNEMTSRLARTAAVDALRARMSQLTELDVDGMPLFTMEVDDDLKHVDVFAFGSVIVKYMVGDDGRLCDCDRDFAPSVSVDVVFSDVVDSAFRALSRLFGR